MKKPLQPTVRINIGRLALGPDTTTDQVLDFADFIADLMPDAAIKVILNGQRHQVAAESDAQALATTLRIERCAALWGTGERRLSQDNARAKAAGDCRALYHDTIPCPPPRGCA